MLPNKSDVFAHFLLRVVLFHFSCSLNSSLGDSKIRLDVCSPHKELPTRATNNYSELDSVDEYVIESTGKPFELKLMFHTIFFTDTYVFNVTGLLKTKSEKLREECYRNQKSAKEGSVNHHFLDSFFLKKCKTVIDCDSFYVLCCITVHLRNSESTERKYRSEKGGEEADDECETKLGHSLEIDDELLEAKFNPFR